MAKAHTGLIKDKEDSKSWQLLFRDLKAAVLGNRITCPKSPFHKEEAKFDGRIEQAIVEVINELSCGLELNFWWDILQLQIEDAAFSFLGKSPPPRDAWSIAFNADPRVPIESRMEYMPRVEGYKLVSDSLTDEVIEEDRNRKRDFAVEGNEILERHRTKPLTWSELLLDGKKGAVLYRIGREAQDIIDHLLQSSSPHEQMEGYKRYVQYIGLWNRLADIGMDTSDPKKNKMFLESEEVLNSPFIKVFGSIWAVIAERDIQGSHGRKGSLLKGSEYYDAVILASAVPYCDVIATERFMKASMCDSRLRFDQEYKSTIFSGSKTDRRAFHELINELI